MVANLSIWLLPSRGSAEQIAFRSVIDKVAAAHSVCSYEPHITLSTLSADFDIARVRSAINELKDSFFQKYVAIGGIASTWVGVYVDAKPEDSLVELHKKFHDHIGVQLQKEWWPHMSLAYITEKQPEAMEEIKASGMYISTDPQGSGEVAGHSSFKVGAIYAAYCGGFKPENWTIFLKVFDDGREEFVPMDPPLAHMAGADPVDAKKANRSKIKTSFQRLKAKLT